MRDIDELGLDPVEVWERVKEYLRRKKPPTPTLPKIPGPPDWTIILAAFALMWLWDRDRRR